MHRFFLIGRTLFPGADVDLSPIRHQLQRVLRMQPGATVVLLNGDGMEYVTELTQVGDRGARGFVVEKRRSAGEPTVQVTLYQCSLKADRMEWVLQKGTELGVSRFVPVISERTIVRPAAKIEHKYERWQTILREAAEQCGRSMLPSLERPATWLDAVGSGSDRGAMRFLPWEEADIGVGLAQCIEDSADVSSPPSIELLIGPEGGLTGEEVQLAFSNGWKVVSLGPRILRAETAAVAAISILMAQLGEIG